MNKVKRKFRKLLRDPKLFFSDMYFKHSIKIKKHLPVKYEGKHQFTIVSAVYNVEKYLDDFFDSIVKQNLSFKKHIQIILVDDGSKDSSANIIKKWQKKYPNNIHYYYKENGGQASARNLGLKYVQTEWVTFIDPDDFISNNYFRELDNFLSMNNELVLVGIPLIFYFEDKKIYKDTHPLKYRFSNGNKIFPTNDLENFIQLSASTALFKTRLINNIKFDEEMKPSFEDAKFVMDYLITNRIIGKVGFISDIQYFYRKREDGSSTLDGAWQNKNLFSKVLKHGCLSILESAEQQFGKIPTYIQRSVLYHLYWYFGRIVNNENALSHLTEYEKLEFSQIVHRIFNKIDKSTIEKFNLGGAWFYHKVGFLGLFKKAEPSFQIAYIKKFDLIKNQVLISFFSYQDANYSLLINGEDRMPSFKKDIHYNFLNERFTNEYRIWLNVQELGNLSILLNGKIAKLSFNGKWYNTLSMKVVREFYQSKSTKKENSWIFIDRDNQADDNAEHLYRYVMNNHPEKDIYFALNKNSKDWDRLNKEGFKLLEFKSKEFENKLKNCSKIISSHIDGYITHYFGDNSLLDKDYIFLQHGVTKDDMSPWLNTKENISIFITTTKDEYNSISEDGSPYRFTKKEVKFLGFPRYDSLLSKNTFNTKNILVMPTWRQNIIGNSVNGSKRNFNSDFMETNYAKHWHNFLNGDMVKKLVNQYGYNIIFAPHPNIQEYLDVFTIPKYINTWRYSEGNIQKLFQEGMMLITDYSSVAFDMAYLEKYTIYYQFDEKEVFSGSHTYRKGYFEYDKHGFGPVARTEDELNAILERFLINKSDNFDYIYSSRIRNTFIHRDQDNCKRVYEAIVKLDSNIPDEQKFCYEIILESIKKAYQNEAWGVIYNRVNYLSKLNLIREEDKEWVTRIYLASIIKIRHFNEIEKFIPNNKYSDIILSLYYETHQHEKALELLSQSPEPDLFMLLYSYSNLYDFFNAKKISIKMLNKVNENLYPIILAYVSASQKNWENVIFLLSKKISMFTKEELKKYEPQLLLAKSYRHLKRYNEAHNMLVAFEKHTKDCSRCRIEISHLAYERADYKKCIDQLNKVFKFSLEYLPEESKRKYIESKNKLQK
ncbi:CDP-glycerol glycerophosphotransferase family protein [Actinobacillus suis]|uniref:Glycosyltransferase 2-like domain-containing protein n=4 Tax=Actinobacillus TaxID=713 RepID=K0G7C3_ACTSU|nr:CDP-glycerol glycerophosphotransferase family protein [Actinobacillus suis]AAO65492.1 unknown [Actinobacillus suis]AFU20148.1 hypothetical protein ASU2_10100 [Actinobacillus suis H91-0380]MCO4167760.1 bifunctional glycosyltransferase family 2 protein/CDP-glycerol:glycerophosphate glycerophosphotransferase [Actinobacillus suis]MCQ9630568.1 bifunctional glycosyltransferase family 2 protein/CDP-glycerol:glycerophosphate glycerophosphotransferase [Actinobacillus suis]MCQ9632901.1 bifunctional g